MSRFFSIFAALLLAVSVSAQQSVPPATDTPAITAEEETGFEQIELFTDVMELIRQNYVDAEKTTYEALVNSALEGMLANLDPHCQFMHPKVFEQLKSETGGTYQGVGISIANRNDVLTIITVREDGPAARAGVLPLDQIIKINQFLTEDIGITEAINHLKGKPGEDLTLTLRRPATQELLEVEMTREVIKQNTVVDAMMLSANYTGPHKIGYARILQFSEPTAEELAQALDELEQQNMEAFVLDLRNNPGGLLSSAVDVCGEFVDAGTTIVTTEGRPGVGEDKPYITMAKRKGRDRDYPVAILVNHSSASGSEVVAGALQDMKRAIIVGETSFGKGSVQSIIPLEGNRAIRMTTAKYYTPSHRTIHENGVVPNIVSSLTPDEEADLNRWFRRKSLNADSRRKIKNFEDRQLVRAVDSMKAALVYAPRREPEVEPGKDIEPTEITKSEADVIEPAGKPN